MSSSRLSTMLFRRAMHSSGRHIPHPPLGGAGTKGPGGSAVPPPQQVATHPPAPSEMITPAPPIDAPLPVDSSTTGVPPPLPTAPGPSAADNNGARSGIPDRSLRKRSNVRPARTIPVTLPNGRPEPSTWPPDDAYRALVENIPESDTPSHPLWKFFHLTPTAMSTPDQEQSAPPELGGMGPMDANPGRAWSAAELRMKSFAELHTLWYLCLRERNTFATVKEERKRWGVHKRMTQMDIGQADKAVRKTMARIKLVLQERRLGLIAALGPQIDDHDATELPMWVDPTESRAAISHEYGQLQELAAHSRNGITYRDVRRSPLFDRHAPASTADEDATVEDGEVGKEEVESRDEGFGGGREAEEFVQETEVDDDGRVKKA